MTSQPNLEALYTEATQALKSKDYDRASGLLKQILVIDENYKDASRLLARIVREKRRRWYNDPRVWSAAGLAIVIGLGVWLAPKLRGMVATQNIPPTNSPTVTPSPMKTEAPTETLTLAPTPVPLVWQRVSLGQEAKRDLVTAIVVDPRDQDVIYVGMEHAGIYKSINGGQSWFPSHEGLASSQVQELALNPQNPQILYAFTFPDQIYRTTDGGQSWSLALDNSENHLIQDFNSISFSRRLILDPGNGRHLLLIDRSGWYESTDGGESWQYQERPWGNCPSVLGGVGFHPTVSATLFLSQLGGDGDCKNGIYRWDGNPTSAPELSFWLDDSRWVRSITDIQSISLPDSSYIYARTERGAVYSSIDGGIAWRGNIQPPGSGPISDPDCPVLTIRPDGQALGFCYTSFEPFGKVMTSYGGQNWKFMSAPSIDWVYLYSTVSSISYFPRQPQSVLLGGQGLFLTLDNGATWVGMNNGLPGISVDLQYSRSDGSLFLMERRRCDGDEPLFHSTDEGQTWTLMTGQGCGLAIAVNGMTLYRSYGNSIFVSRDGGLSWGKGARPTINNSQIVSLATDPIQPDIVILKISIGGNPNRNSEFYVSLDRGFTWQKRGGISENNSPEDALFYAPGQSEIIYSVGLQSNVFRLDNEEGNWTACAPIDAASPNSASILAIHPNDPNRIFLATLGKGIQYSADGCESWTAVNRGLESLFVSTIAIDPNSPDTVYAGTDGGAYVSFDFGQTWHQINDGLLGATVVYSIVVDKDSNVYAATPYGIFKLESK